MIGIDRVAIVLFTRDLRVHDHPGLAEAATSHDKVVPLFVFDDTLLRSVGANRIAFLLEALQDLRQSLRERGADLVVRRGEPVAETMRVARAIRADTVLVAADVSRYAQLRQRRLSEACAGHRIQLRVLGSTSAIAPGTIAPEGRDHYRVFTPYWRRWNELPLAPIHPAPRQLRLPSGLDLGAQPSLRDLSPVVPSSRRMEGGERIARLRLDWWLANGHGAYERGRDRLAPPAGSRLSPYLHFGCLSPGEVVARARRRGETAEFVRQLCWRDFYNQLLAANPGIQTADLNARQSEWSDDREGFDQWREGQTGVPIVDAAMRQLHDEGWLPNRARLIVGSFLTQTLDVDWRLGARVFSELLVDADVANNVGNWQWVAGTGTDTRPGRALNPARQARRFDPNGDYVRRYAS